LRPVVNAWGAADDDDVPVLLLLPLLLHRRLDERC
jgi:hypothetical protein